MLATVLTVLRRMKAALPALTGAIFALGDAVGALGTGIGAFIQRRFSFRQAIIGTA
jgi:hypothetical protein